MTKVDVIVAGAVTEEVIITTPQPTTPPPALTPDVGLVEIEQISTSSIWMTGPVPPTVPGRVPGDMYLGADGDVWQWNGTEWIDTGINISSSDTPLEILAKLITVDGEGSGLDADLLDGHDSTYFATDADLDALAGSTDTRLDAVELKDAQQDTAIGNLQANDTVLAGDTADLNSDIVRLDLEQDAQDAAIALRLTDAPSDGLVYGRKNANWSTVIGGAHTDINPPPPPLQDGQLWCKSDTGAMYIWYVDANSSQWVQIAGGIENVAQRRRNPQPYRQSGHADQSGKRRYSRERIGILSSRSVAQRHVWHRVVFHRQTVSGNGVSPDLYDGCEGYPRRRGLCIFQPSHRRSECCRFHVGHAQAIPAMLRFDSYSRFGGTFASQHSQWQCTGSDVRSTVHRAAANMDHRRDTHSR